LHKFFALFVASDKWAGREDGERGRGRESGEREREREGESAILCKL